MVGATRGLRCQLVAHRIARRHGDTDGARRQRPDLGRALQLATEGFRRPEQRARRRDVASGGSGQDVAGSRSVLTRASYPSVFAVTVSVFVIPLMEWLPIGQVTLYSPAWSVTWSAPFVWAGIGAEKGPSSPGPSILKLWDLPPSLCRMKFVGPAGRVSGMSILYSLS